MDEYLVPTQAADAEYTVQRSRFIGHIRPVENEEQALTLLKQTREKYWNANHNVYAYIIHGGATRYSDDSEPQGTAGMPVLDVLRKTGLENVLCIVTRYFGGILLGAGGLVRAYTKSASLAVDAAGISKKQVWVTVDVPCVGGDVPTVRLSNSDYVRCPLPDDARITKTVECDRFFTPPVARGDAVGTVVFYADGKEVASAPLFAEHGAAESPGKLSFTEQILNFLGR